MENFKSFLPKLFGKKIWEKIDREEWKDFIEDVNSLNKVIKANKYINKLEDLRRVIIRLNDRLQPSVRAINIVLNEINNIYGTVFGCKCDEEFYSIFEEAKEYLTRIIENKISEEIIKKMFKQ